MIAAGMLIDPVGTITVYYYCYDCCIFMISSIRIIMLITSVIIDDTTINMYCDHIVLMVVMVIHTVGAITRSVIVMIIVSIIMIATRGIN